MTDTSTLREKIKALPRYAVKHYKITAQTDDCGDLLQRSEVLAILDATALAAHDQRIRREVWEEAATLIEADCKRVLDCQDGTIAQVDANIRLIALLLPDLAEACRARASKEGR